jgi:hypothetical protein
VYPHPRKSMKASHGGFATTFGLVLAGAILVAACDRERIPLQAPPPAPSASLGAQPARPLLTPSDLLASRIPEFGGAFIDKTGVLNV